MGEKRMRMIDLDSSLVKKNICFLLANHKRKTYIGNICGEISAIMIIVLLLQSKKVCSRIVARNFSIVDFTFAQGEGSQIT